MPLESQADGVAKLRSILSRSPQKRLIVGFVRDGLTNKQIGMQLSRSEHTVHTLLAELYDALDIQSRVTLGVLYQVLESSHENHGD